MADSAYCSRTELYLWGAPSPAFSDVEPDNQDAGIVGASAFIDSYIGNRFVLPLVSYGADYKRCCAIISAYDLIFATRGVNPDEDGPKDPLLLRYEQMIEWLEGIRDGGSSSAVGSPVPVPGTDTGSGALVTSNSMRGWQDDRGAVSSGAFSGRRR